MKAIKKFIGFNLFLSVFYLQVNADLFEPSTTLNTKDGEKTIKLMKIDPKNTQNSFFDFFFEKDNSTITEFSDSPTAVEIGMSNVPVLDQGQYGTCVTFATTAALNAALNQGDYISQQCTLEMIKATGSDLWDGAYTALEVYGPLAKFGMVSKQMCANAYPNRFATTTLESYKLISEQVVGTNAKYHASITVQDAKKAIDERHRVAIGFGLLNNGDQVSVQGFDVQVSGKEKGYGGLWACAQFTLKWSYYCGQAQAGHEVVITGYDDAQQLFKIRNSWGTVVGENGDFYMTYTFFENMVMDGTEIW